MAAQLATTAVLAPCGRAEGRRAPRTAASSAVPKTLHPRSRQRCHEGARVRLEASSGSVMSCATCLPRQRRSQPVGEHELGPRSWHGLGSGREGGPLSSPLALAGPCQEQATLPGCRAQLTLAPCLSSAAAHNNSQVPAGRFLLPLHRRRSLAGAFPGTVTGRAKAQPLRSQGPNALASLTVGHAARSRQQLWQRTREQHGCCARLHHAWRTLAPSAPDREQAQRLGAAASSATPNPSPSNPSAKSQAPTSGEPRAVPVSPPAAPVGRAKEDMNWRLLLEKAAPPADASAASEAVWPGLDASSLPAQARAEDLVAVQEQEQQQLEQFLESRLPMHPKLYRGVLGNGLRYVILPNSVPPNRFEAHLEMHAGSVDEEEHEQGLAHLVEHVTFLGSRKREKLLGTGARSNAYTDFHHTVFHVHAPCTMQGSEEPMLPMVLEALHEIAFQPRFLPSRIDKERRAVLSEAQMMNTIEYRVDCQLLQQLHAENKIGCRFPIGREEQVPQWDVETIKAFHRRWYFPANATLYVVGDIGSVSQTVKLIENEFGKIPPALEDLPEAAPGGGQAPAQGVAAAPDGGAPQEALASAPASPVLGRKQRQSVRPPVRHRWARPLEEQRPGTSGALLPGLPPLPPQGLVTPTLFQHELLQNFALTVFCKNPVKPVRRYRELREALMGRIAAYALQFRINKRYKSGEIPFMSISLDHSDSAREGCTVSTLTVVSEPQNWEGAVRLAVQEVRRLKEFGLTAGELTRYLTALMKDSEHVAAMIGTIPSLDNLDFIMENDALCHTIMDQEQAHECLSAVAPTITLEDVNKVASWVLEYIADYGTPGAPEPAAIVACVPTHMHPLSGEASPSEPGNGATGAGSGSSGEGSVPFVITPEAIRRALVEGLEAPLTPEPEIEVPKALLTDDELEELVRSVQPHFVPLPVPAAPPSLPARMGGALAPAEGDSPVAAAEGPLVLADPDTGIIQRRLSNGIRLNMKYTENEAKGGMLRLVVPGGRVEETPGLPGAVAIGVRALSESGSVASFSLEQVELFCLANQINCALEADEEFVCMDFHFSSRHGGLKATFQLLHMVLQQSKWHEDALDRAKQLYLSHFRSLPKSLERYSAYMMLRAMFGNDPRLLEPSPEAIAKLTLEGVQDAVTRQLLSGHMEVSVVGDFSVDEVEQLALHYLGTVTALPPPEVAAAHPIVSKPIPFVDVRDPAVRHQKVHLRDTDERARAYIAGAAPNRWGFTADGRDVNTLMEPVPLHIAEPPLPAAAQEEKEAAGVLGRLIKGFFGAAGDKGQAQAQASAQEPRLSSALARNVARVEQAKAMAPLGVSVVEGPDGRPYWRKRRHPLFAATGMMLLTEIINARLFTTVRDALGLTYDVTFEVSTFDRMPMGWFVISVTSTPDKISQAVEASINVLQGIQATRITQRELDRARRTLLMRHESDLKDNGYWLGLLTHIQCDAVPRKDATCVRDLPTLYEVMTVEDVYSVYDQLLVDDKSLYTCIGVAGANGEPLPDALEPPEDQDLALAVPDVYPAGAPGRRTSMMTRPTE